MHPEVIVVDDNPDLCVVIKELIVTKFNIGCLIASGLGDVISREAESLNCKLAILDINLGYNQPNGLKVFEWLKDKGFLGKVCFLTGHAKCNPMVKMACLSGAKVFEKPLVPNDLYSLVREVFDEF